MYRGEFATRDLHDFDTAALDLDEVDPGAG